MRRKEFEMMDHAETEAFLQEMSFGVLGTINGDGWPELTPLNFVYHNGHIYFHGSVAGRKMKNLKADQRVTFSVAKEYAIIPSYFTEEKLACPATAFFKSVIIKGFAEIVPDLTEKAEALTAFMQKLQPEGGYAPIDPEDPDYTGQIKSTSVVRINVQEMSAKYKFGQNAKQPAYEKISDGLIERNQGLDKETVAMMEALCPHHRKNGDDLA
ncbi:pyridoxamine 5'-phosphate oxidase family protein [Paenibacillus alvei]|uniref:Pyridoxamine 5'-phosphate oxidase family protein n=1 Tax=Paenibacillus alvei TaxID=44250 RepID=A0ABT4H6W3_PAEAL|nr:MULTISPECIES: pyridoxamine 5'-phosphate oxidase family protein [Paenibacillus]EJW17241.1 putative flavin-nucleotide-binding protein [Paenibacillus alvei DSM 29]MCY9542320.1 pyridoxamine 5'-phosphate oxidase family protein [Paenibacillus alvei]MCY9705378.1 pyridoxamine 5'-phosphate oxidase family protein [Paenibacillus alvei]MCY9735103.1 pyridoxamine 5'-phosphate oxidase family protein [Paenibacillus alvei]MCY9753308.1 pyridoxamine 5'-phosphate oxidase family protein [Paenibacillus alvei]